MCNGTLNCHLLACFACSFMGKSKEMGYRRELIVHGNTKIQGKVKFGVLFLCLFTSAIFLISCQATNQGSRSFTSSQAQAVMPSFYGRIVHVREVQLQSNDTTVGGAAWNVLYSVTNPTSNRRAPAIATVGNDTSAGAAARERVHATLPGWELEVELESGEILIIIQEQDETFKVGDHVRIIEAPDGSFRVRQ